MKNISKSNKSILIFGVIASILYAFVISHIDCNTITTWGYDLLESIRKVGLRNYPVYTYEVHGMATNYNLFVNVITAIWILPIYIVNVMCSDVIQLGVFVVYYKLLVIIIHFLNVYLLYKLLKKFGFVTDKIVYGLFIYMTSAIVLITVVGKGQVDNISVFFMLIGANMLIEKKYIKMSIVFGLSMCIKPFSVLIIVPVMLLLISKCRYKIIYLVIIEVVPFIIDFSITKFLMPDYFKMKAITSQQFKEAFGMSRIEQLFNIHINNVLIYWAVALVICFICLRLGVKQEVNKRHYLIFPMLMFVLFGLFVNDTCYWFINILPIIILIGLSFNEVVDFLLLNIGLNIGVSLYTFVLEKQYRPGLNYSSITTIFSNLSKQAELVPPSQMDIYIYQVGATLYITCMLLIIGIYVYEILKKKENTVSSLSKAKKIFILLQPIPVVLYFIFSIVA